MVIDKKGKLFGKISIVDIIIILVVILALGAGFVRFSGGISDITARTVNIEYTYELKSIRQASVDSLNRHGSFYKKSAGEDFMGTITNVEIFPNDDFSLNANGEYVKTSAPERFDAIVTVTIPGKVMDSTIYTSTNQKLEAGSQVYMFTKWIACGGDIKSVKILD